MIFLSTPSARRATNAPIRLGDNNNISIHALREEGDAAGVQVLIDHFISIHALREEGDLRNRRNAVKLRKFLSTPSARRATWLTVGSSAGRLISIHALREEGDIPKKSITGSNGRFLSTPSARRATSVVCPRR